MYFLKNDSKFSGEYLWNHFCDLYSLILLFTIPQVAISAFLTLDSPWAGRPASHCQDQEEELA